MTDLTAITTPYGLLDRETQEALKAHGRPIEVYTGSNGWELVSEPSWVSNAAYRVKPAPPKPRERWLVEYDTISGPTEAVRHNEYDAQREAAALRAMGTVQNVRVSRFREVLPE